MKLDLKKNKTLGKLAAHILYESCYQYKRGGKKIDRVGVCVKPFPALWSRWRVIHTNTHTHARLLLQTGAELNAPLSRAGQPPPSSIPPPLLPWCIKNEAHWSVFLYQSFHLLISMQDVLIIEKDAQLSKTSNATEGKPSDCFGVTFILLKNVLEQPR